MAEVKTDVSPKIVDAPMYSNTLALTPVSSPQTMDDIPNADSFQYHYWQIQISGISGTVVIRAEGSLNGTNFFNLAADGSDTSYTANGTYLLSSTRGIRAKIVRLNFVSGTGTITAFYRGGN
jgi:hypothetical protein